MSLTELTSPAVLRGKSLPELQDIAEDIRQAIISTCLKNGGHLGASLGAVEIAIALHFAFESPDEAIVWDVGHQAYAHKLLTGRADRFSTLRTSGGLSGFLSREESPHDVFGAGHSSTALSAALAIAWARGRERGAGVSPGNAGAADRAGAGKPAAKWTVAVVGDGGLTAGLAFEALNGIANEPIGPLLVLLNDNQMSISANVGGISRLLSQGRAREYFDLLGLDYFGPVDGHDLEALIATLNSARAGYSGRPVVVHAYTQKGRGYAPAESAPASYHGVSPLSRGNSNPSYSESFGQALCRLAENDSRVVAITAAMPEGTGLTEFARRFPERFFDVGIAEAHAVTFAAGLATQGYRPVVAIYSTFLQRACDSIIHDVAIQKLNVILAIDRAGIVGGHGPTHHGAFDLALLGAIPGMSLAAPACLRDVEVLLESALKAGGPWAIRYPRGSGLLALAELGEHTSESSGKHAAAPAGSPPDPRWLLDPPSPRAAIIALGAASERALAAAKGAAAPVAAFVTVFAKPLSPRLVDWLRERPNLPLLLVEDGAARGGFGQALAAELGPRRGRIDYAGYADHFIAHGSPAALEESEQLSAAALGARLQALIEIASP